MIFFLNKGEPMTMNTKNIISGVLLQKELENGKKLFYKKARNQILEI